MGFEFKRTGVKNTITVVTTTTPAELIPAASGFITSLTQFIAANRGELNTIDLWEGNTKITPTMAIPASGTLFIDDFAGFQRELTRSSGLFVRLGVPGDIEFQPYYLQHDKRTPITKEAARAATYTNVTVSRAIG